MAWFQKVLIANRGEIAVRVIRTCRELGIASVAIYSEPDRDALHVRLADYAYPCGGAAPRDSYLLGDRVLEIAQRCGANAIHPGYGFLAENADFSDACAKTGTVFIGPSGEVIRTMGAKATARRRMQDAGVPVMPGSDGAIDDASAASCAQEIGFPVMVKASAGGGGKGLRRVADPAQLAGALERVRGESLAAFGDDALYIEKCIEGARHIEVQFISDAHGNAVALGERECSIQRRHQKLIEETPANAIGPELRAQMSAATLAAAKTVAYRGVGTCEFLVAPDGAFFFLEMNTRIQVEHAITEEVTGIDIVAEMIRVAAGEPLGIGSGERGPVHSVGHAIEARIYAEDSERGFNPSPGTIDVYRPPGGIGVRVDSGVEAGSLVTTHYDPLVAKLIVWGEDRPSAIARMRGALSEFAIGGIATSIPFHIRALCDPAFEAGNYTTDFVEELQRKPTTDPAAQRAIAFRLAAYWWVQQSGAQSGRLEICEKHPTKGEFVPVDVRFGDSGPCAFTVDGQRSTLDVAGGGNGQAFSVIESGCQFEVVVMKKGKNLNVRTPGGAIPGGATTGGATTGGSTIVEVREAPAERDVPAEGE